MPVPLHFHPCMLPGPCISAPLHGCTTQFKCSHIGVSLSSRSPCPLPACTCLVCSSRRVDMHTPACAPCCWTSAAGVGRRGPCPGGAPAPAAQEPARWGGGAVLTDIDECLSNPCVNGVCRNLAGSYACECAPGSRLGPSGTVCLGERPHGATRAPTPRGVSWVFVGLCAGVGPPGERVGPSPQTAPKAPAG